MVEEVAFGSSQQLRISINKIPLEIAAVFFNEAISFIPCFRYADGGQDVVLFTSPNIQVITIACGIFQKFFFSNTVLHKRYKTLSQDYIGVIQKPRGNNFACF